MTTPQYGSEIEKIARQSISNSQSTMAQTSKLINNILKQQYGTKRTFGMPVRGQGNTKGPVKNGPPVGLNSAPFAREIIDPLKDFTITDVFGGRTHPISGEYSNHTGIDLAAGQGTPIRASADGYVRKAGYDTAYGKQTVLGHGNGWQTMYGHQARILVKPGQKVRRGQIIGYVGTTGYSTGPHLHWEVWRKRNPINPRRFLR